MLRVQECCRKMIIVTITEFCICLNRQLTRDSRESDACTTYTYVGNCSYLLEAQENSRENDCPCRHDHLSWRAVRQILCCRSPHFFPLVIFLFCLFCLVNIQNLAAVSVKYIVKLRSVILYYITLYRIARFALSCIMLYCAICKRTMLGILFSSALPSNILTWYLHHGRPGLGGEFPVSTRSSMIAASAGPTRLVQSNVLWKPRFPAISSMHTGVSHDLVQ